MWNLNQIFTHQPLRSAKAPEEQSGVVLLVVLMLVAVLVVVALESFRLAQVDMSNAYYFQNQLQSRNLARSGLTLTNALLVKDLEENDYDYLGEPWSQPLEQDTIPLPEIPPEELDLTITDESAKFPINYLVKQDTKDRENVSNATLQESQEGKTTGLRKTYARIFVQMIMHEPFSLSREKAEALLTSIKNWIDPDTLLEQEAETEDEFYLAQDTPYKSKNGPLSTVGELLLIRGITDKLYRGSEGTPGLKKLISTYSPDGKININSAHPIILQAMVNPSLDRETAKSFAEEMAAYRQDPMHQDFLKEPDWYRNRMVGYNDVQLPAKLVTTKSSVFRVESCGKKGLGQACLTVYLKRMTDAKHQEQKGKPILEPLYRELH